MCFGFISDCSSQQCSISQIYISPAEWLRKHLMNKEFCSSAQELPSGTPGTWMVCLECQRNAEQAPPRAEWYQIPRHYFGTSGAAKWRGNLRLATSKPVTGHTSKILRRRGISCVLQEALRIPNPAALQQPASQGMFPCHQTPPHLGCMVIITCGPGSCLVSKKPWLCCLTKAAALWPISKSNLLTSKPTEAAKSGNWVSAQVPLEQCLSLSCWELQQRSSATHFIRLNPLKIEYCSLFST